MADNLNFEPVFIKQLFPLEKDKTRMSDMCQKGETLFDKISGEQYLVTKKKTTLTGLNITNWFLSQRDQ